MLVELQIDGNLATNIHRKDHPIPGYLDTVGRDRNAEFRGFRHNRRFHDLWRAATGPGELQNLANGIIELISVDVYRTIVHAQKQYDRDDENVGCATWQEAKHDAEL